MAILNVTSCKSRADGSGTTTTSVDSVGEESADDASAATIAVAGVVFVGGVARLLRHLSDGLAVFSKF